MEEVVDEYTKPYDPLHSRVCLDESPRQLIGERRKSFTDENGTEYVDYVTAKDARIKLKRLYPSI
ncbi:MAG: hypothetical protein D3924_07510 [Candidatus Electrothrix sp. AR4]|nr:hypothetical protein [Candidatus Electrothrix sp. AR4]